MPLAEGGFLPAGTIASVQQTLVSQIAATNGHATTGFIGNKFVYSFSFLLSLFHLLCVIITVSLSADNTGFSGIYSVSQSVSLSNDREGPPPPENGYLFQACVCQSMSLSLSDDYIYNSIYCFP